MRMDSVLKKGGSEHFLQMEPLPSKIPWTDFHDAYVKGFFG